MGCSRTLATLFATALFAVLPAAALRADRTSPSKEQQQARPIHPQDTGFLNRVIVLNGVSYR